jgi:uncharacterized protein with PIN domain
MTKVIKLMGMIEDLRAEIDNIRPQKLRCSECDEYLMRVSMPTIDDQGDAVIVSETWYCPECVDVEIVAKESLETH